MHPDGAKDQKGLLEVVWLPKRTAVKTEASEMVALCISAYSQFLGGRLDLETVGTMELAVVATLVLVSDRRDVSEVAV